MLTSLSNAENQLELDLERGRQDNADNFPSNQRRLDSFARLLAAHSMCVAVSIISDRLYITANEIFSRTKIDEGRGSNIIAINNIANYFVDVANKKEIDETRRKILFTEICSKARFQESCPHGLAEEISKNVFEKADLKVSEIITIYGANSDIAARMYVEFMKLREDFFKLEEHLNKSNEGSNVFRNGFSILNVEEKGVHAEMKLLAKIIDAINFSSADTMSSRASSSSSSTGENKSSQEKIYIGISKLCCLNCRCMIDAANQQLKTNGIKSELLVTGHHDLSFDQNWNPPEIFKVGYNSVMRSSRRKIAEDKKNSLQFLIGKTG